MRAFSLRSRQLLLLGERGPALRWQPLLLRHHALWVLLNLSNAPGHAVAPLGSDVPQARLQAGA